MTTNSTTNTPVKGQIKALRDEIKQRLNNSSFPYEMRLIYLLSTSLDILVRDADSRIRTTAASLGVPNSSMRTDLFKGMQEYCKATRAAEYWMEKAFDPMGEIECKVDGAQAFDDLRLGANGILKLIMMFSDRVDSEEDVDALVSLLTSLPSRGAFSQTDLDRIQMR